MKTRHLDLPPLTATEWSTVAAALTVGDVKGDAVFTQLARRVRTVLTGKAPVVETVDARTAAIRAFVQDTRRWQRPAATIAPSLIAHGFNQHQVAALAALSIH